MNYWQKKLDALKALGRAAVIAGSALAELNTSVKLSAALIEDLFAAVTAAKREQIEANLIGWMPKRWAAFIAERIPEGWLRYINI